MRRRRLCKKRLPIGKRTGSKQCRDLADRCEVVGGAGKRPGRAYQDEALDAFGMYFCQMQRDGCAQGDAAGDEPAYPLFVCSATTSAANIAIEKGRRVPSVELPCPRHSVVIRRQSSP
ncbi:hypothetical protein AJ87_40380 [Rhizobium yanglingense]|nr:hypothetical protein AJ87_40380 [Rhizobium yanglingense]